MPRQTISATWDRRSLGGLEPGPFKRAAGRALLKAGATALRDMRSEARKRIAQRKRIKAKYISRALKLRRSGCGSDIASMSWAVIVSGEPVPLLAYPGRQTKKGVSVEVNRDKRTVLKGAFVASLKSGHVGVFQRRAKARLPIKELFGSRPVDALLHDGEAQGVAARGAKSLADTFGRLLTVELGR